MVETRAPPRQRGGIWRWSSAVGCACERGGRAWAWCSRAAGPTQPDRIRSRLGARVLVPSQVGRLFPELGGAGRGGARAGRGAGPGRGAVEANAATDVSVQPESLAPTCLDPEPTPGPPPRQEQMTPAYLQPRLHLWRVCQDPITALDERQETRPSQHRPGWEPMALQSADTPPLASQRSQGLEPPRAPPAPPLRRPRKQPRPRKGMEEGDPQFQGVTLNFEIKSDASLQIVPSYSGLAHVGGGSSSHAQEPPPAPAAAPEVNTPGPSETLGPRRCASCGTQRTPLWRDAEDGTPLCNACGIRYKKYGTRCSSCWLVPRKSVQVRRLCCRCGITWGSRGGPAD